ncbi:MAG: transcriptional repressor [Paludibacteraceae bacterium]|nr:transcriptional repressor [Paludibacteraceae bacterium]
MNSPQIVNRLEQKGVKPTANRILVYRLLQDAGQPVNLTEMEERLGTLDKSSIFRVIQLFAKKDVVHSFIDGRGIVNYELCHHTDTCHHGNDHIHFYCETCHQSFCIENIHVPMVTLPSGYIMRDVSFVVKGECPNCAQRHSS